MELQKQKDEAAARVNAVLARAEEQGLMIESLHTSVSVPLCLDLCTNTALAHYISGSMQYFYHYCWHWIGRNVQKVI